MAQDFNPFKILDDVGKGVAETAGTVAKAVQDEASTLASGIADAAGGIIGPFDSDSRKPNEYDVPEQKEIPPKYRDNREVESSSSSRARSVSVKFIAAQKGMNARSLNGSCVCLVRALSYSL